MLYPMLDNTIAEASSFARLRHFPCSGNCALLEPMAKTMNYKLRAECSADVEGLRSRLDANATNWKIIGLALSNGAPIPDVEATFKSALPLESLRRHAKGVPDGHVMAETVALAARYTGER